MSDKPMSVRLRHSLRWGGALALVLSSPALGGETVVYADAPPWVEPADLASIDFKKAPATLLFDWQHRLEGGVVTTYEDYAARIDNPEMLMDEGTLSLEWMPDKGDLTIHRVEILRDGKIIDVLGDGTAFEVIRREQGLEQRLLDGQLTATLAVPGLKVGDILRVSHSVSTDDQALGDEMQASQYLVPEPWRVGFSRAIVSWPENETVFFRAEDFATLPEPVSANGYRKLTVSLPIAEAPDMPVDAPSRYSRSPILRVGTFADWQELSRTFAPLYYAAATVADGSEVAGEASKIMRQARSPLERAALALQLVQDDVSYLLNGLDGGNYMPQTADLTWANRYGDCKAKSVLLTALLRRMGIEATPVLVSTQGGDALPELLPIPGDFDHVIVRATIDGQDYWLDGTSTASRLGNIGDVPPFFHALPLVATGADLVPMIQREKAVPDMVMNIVTDYSAGVDFPTPFDLTMTFTGPAGARMRAMVDQADEQALKTLGKQFAASAGAGAAITAIDLDYDDDTAQGIISLSGVVGSQFAWRDGRLQLDPAADNQIDFSPDRARKEWRDIPVQTPGPARSRIEGTVILPDNMPGFALKGPVEIDESYANTRLVAKTVLKARRIESQVEVIQQLGEIAPADIAEQKRAARRLAAMQTEVVAPDNIVWRWELSPDDMKRRAAPILAAYDKAVAFAADDDFGPLAQRASFRADMYDWDGALADLATLIAEKPSAAMHSWRASILESLGKRSEAIADAQTAYDLEPNTAYALQLAELMAYGGQQDEALALLESLPVDKEDSGSYASTYATVAGLDGKTEQALAVLDRKVSEEPLNASVLNADCWFRGLFDVGTEQAMATCTRAVERAENSAPMLDSRAMVSYRRGDYGAALADLNSALQLAPGLSASMYLRGIVRLEQGDKGGKTDIEQALRMSPGLSSRYAAHGVVPKG